jgi:hypothetical protein
LRKPLRSWVDPSFGKSAGIRTQCARSSLFVPLPHSLFAYAFTFERCWRRGIFFGSSRSPGQKVAAAHRSWGFTDRIGEADSPEETGVALLDCKPVEDGYGEVPFSSEKMLLVVFGRGITSACSCSGSRSHCTLAGTWRSSPPLSKRADSIDFIAFRSEPRRPCIPRSMIQGQRPRWSASWHKSPGNETPSKPFPAVPPVLPGP